MVVATCDTSMQTAHHQAEVKAGRGWRPAEPGTRRVGAGLHRGPGAATGVRSLPYQQSNALAIEMEGKEWGIVRKNKTKPKTEGICVKVIEDTIVEAGTLRNTEGECKYLVHCYRFCTLDTDDLPTEAVSSGKNSRRNHPAEVGNSERKVGASTGDDLLKREVENGKAFESEHFLLPHPKLI